MGRRTPPRAGTITMPVLTEQEVKELMGSEYLPPPPRPTRIRATTPNPSRTVRATASIEESVQKINDLYAWAEQNDPPPAWWRRRARREWRNRWGLT